MAVQGMAQHLDIELSSGCDHRCSHCYNVWTSKEGGPQHGRVKSTRGLETRALESLISLAVEKSGAEHLTITGGEPLLRKDALHLIRHASSLVPTLQLITNGSHVDPETARALAEAGVRSVQLTFLAGHRELHDRLKGAVCFDDTLRAALNLRDVGVPTQCCFVAMAENYRELEAVMELCSAVGVHAISYNRMSPTGGAIHHAERLVPTAEQVEQNLDTLERLGPRYGIRCGTAMPIPPCMIRIERYSWVNFGFCSTGSDTPHLVMDTQGDIRACNLSSETLGNVTTDDWESIIGNPYLKGFKKKIPDVCRGCAYERSCQGGCKESAISIYGDATHAEPFLWMNQGARETL